MTELGIFFAIGTILALAFAWYVHYTDTHPKKKKAQSPRRGSYVLPCITRPDWKTPAPTRSRQSHHLSLAGPCVPTFLRL